MLELRPYQKECLKAIETAEAEGIKRQLLSLPTGTGKTLIFSSLAKQRDDSSLILAHRDELIEQAVEKLRLIWPAADVGVVKAERNEIDHQVIVASVQTLSRESRLEKFPKDFDLVITDEAHHCHVPGTQVLTNTGYKTIETLEVGERVYGWNGENRSLYPITKHFKYWYNGPIINITTESGKHVSVTPNHKLYSNGRKVYASEVQQGQSLSMPTMQLENNPCSGSASTFTVASSRKKALYPMLRNHEQRRVVLPPRNAQKRDGILSVLWQILRETLDWRSYKCHPCGQSDVLAIMPSEGDEQAQSKQRISSLPFLADEEKQSNVQPYYRAQDGRNNSPKSDRRGTYSLWQSRSLWERWPPNTLRTICAFLVSGGGVSTCCCAGRWGASIPLQDRFRMVGKEDCSGNRWIFACRTGESRPPKGLPLVSTRLGGHSSDQRGSVIREDEIASVKIRHYTGWIYDIEVFNVHNYIANGVLSSNSVANTYRRVYDHLGVIGETKTDTLHLGVTATPNRADNVGLGDVFDEVVYQKDLLDMIRNSYLCDLRCEQIQTEIDLSDVSRRGGDYAVDGLAPLINTENANDLIVESWLEHAADRRTLTFTVDVAHAKDLAQTFRNEGIDAESIWGNMPLDKRRAILRDFATGNIQVVTNCGVLTEGYDNPRIDCIIIARPTKSSGLYTQMIGRGTRTHPEKEDCLILDVACISDKHDIVSFPNLFGLKDLPDDGETLTDAVDRETIEASGTPYGLGVYGNEMVSREVDLFAASRLVWITNERGYVLNLGQPGRIFVYEAFEDPTRYHVFHQSGDELNKLTDAPADLSWSLGIAESNARQIARGNLSLVDKSAPWRKDFITEKQVATLCRFGIKFNPEITKGEASTLLSQFFAGRVS